MKRIFALLAIALFIVVLFSCDIPELTKPDVSNPEESSLVVLELESISERGMTGMPEDVPFFYVNGGQETFYDGDDTPYGFWASCFTLRALPIFPGITTVNKSAEVYCNSLNGKEFKGLGVPMRISKATKTEDGIYLVYDILEEERKVGQIEYYYSIKEKKFSYREIVTPLFGVYGADNIFIFELMDVPVEMSKSGLSFKAGEIYENGSYFNSYNINFSPSGCSNLDVVDNVLFDIQKITMNYNNFSVDTASFTTQTKRVDLKEKIDFTVSGRDMTLNYDDTVLFLQEFFQSSIRGGSNDYKTLKDFDDSGLKILVDLTDTKTQFRLALPISFNLKKKIAAVMINGEYVTASNFVGDGSNYYPMSEFIKKRFEEAEYDLDGITLVTDDIKVKEESFDLFVQELLKKLNVSMDEDQRKKLLLDSYNSSEPL